MASLINVVVGSLCVARCALWTALGAVMRAAAAVEVLSATPALIRCLAGITEALEADAAPRQRLVVLA